MAYADYLYLRKRQLITDANFNEYIKFIVAKKIRQLSNTGKMKVSSYITKLLDVQIANEEVYITFSFIDIIFFYLAM